MADFMKEAAENLLGIMKAHMSGPFSDVRLIAFDMDDTLTEVDNTIKRADEYIYDYMSEEFPNMMVSSPSEISNEIMTLFASHKDESVSFGHLRPEVYGNRLKKAGYDERYGDVLYQKWNTKRNQFTFLPGAVELLQYCYNKGYQIGVITNGTSNLENYPDVERMISVFVNPILCGASKPSAIPFQMAMKNAGIEKSSSCLMVGDTYESDIEGARRCGWKTVYINRGKEKRSDQQADMCVESVEEMLRIILREGIL